MLYQMNYCNAGTLLVQNKSNLPPATFRGRQNRKGLLAQERAERCSFFPGILKICHKISYINNVRKNKKRSLPWKRLTSGSLMSGPDPTRRNPWPTKREKHEERNTSLQKVCPVYGRWNCYLQERGASPSPLGHEGADPRSPSLQSPAIGSPCVVINL